MPPKKPGKTDPKGVKAQALLTIEDGEIPSTSSRDVQALKELMGPLPPPVDHAVKNITFDDMNQNEELELQDILNQVDANFNDDNEVLELDPQVEQMLADLDKNDEYGVEVGNLTARTFRSINQLTVTKELLDKWKLELKTPVNCQEVTVPAVNPPIWNGLPMNAKTSDAKMQALQQNLVRAQVAHMFLMDEMLALVSKEKMPRLLKPLLDSSKCISAAIQDINQKRRQGLKPFLKPEYAGLNSNRVEVTSFLYGDDLEKNMKEAKAASAIVKPTMGIQGRRFHPYKSTNFGRTPVNYYRPSPTMGRGGQYPKFQRTPFQRNRQGFNKQVGQSYRRQ